MAKDIEIMKLYLDGTKSFVQLSSAGLALPIVLSSKVIDLFRTSGHFNHLSLTFVCISWACFLTSIGAGALYQYVAVKFLEYEGDKQTYVPGTIQWLVKGLGPGVAYGAMVVAFYGGAISVVIYSLTATLYG
jgi:hypothetical protein